MESLWPLIFIVFLSNLVQACLGFGAIVLAVTFGVWFLPIEGLVPRFVPITLVLSLLLILRYPKEVDWAILFKRTLPITVPALFVGVLLFNQMPGRELKLTFGAIVAALAVRELIGIVLVFRSRNRAAKNGAIKPIPLRFWQSFIFLFAGGMMQGLYASGGPFVVYFASREIADKRVFRTTLAALWMILNLALIATYVMSGKFTQATLRDSALLLPSVVAGTFAGTWLHDRINPDRFRVAVYVVLLIAGLSLVHRTLTT